MKSNQYKKIIDDAVVKFVRLSDQKICQNLISKEEWRRKTKNKKPEEKKKQIKEIWKKGKKNE